MGEKMIVCGTGHRPEDSEPEGIVRLKAATKLRYTPGVQQFVTGMAAGFDLWAGDEARMLGIDIVCAVPWRGHEPRVADRKLYSELMAAAKTIKYVLDEEDYPGPWVYQKRNEWMVDNSEAVMAYWSGVEKGGTWNCVKYARAQKKKRPELKITNIYNDPPF
jgi:uncharacterized phage-like protein YoqJ